MVVDELVQGVELDDPEEVLARVVAKDLEVLHMDARAVVNADREREAACGKREREKTRKM